MAEPAGLLVHDVVLWCCLVSKLREENKKLRRDEKVAKQKQTTASPTSVADGLVQLGFNTMPGKHKITKAEAIVNNLEVAYRDAGKSVLERNVIEIMQERYDVIT